MKKLVFMVPLAFAGPGLTDAQPVSSPPLLSSAAGGINSQVSDPQDGDPQSPRGHQTGAVRSPLKISQLALSARLAGGFAEMRYTFTVHNRGRVVEEARIAIPLPRGAVVNGYALDVGGRLIDGVLVDQPEAKRVYEREVRQRVDPGLGEVSDANVFTTRVYPLFPRGTRQVSVRFTVPLDSAGGVTLSFPRNSQVDQLTLSFRVSDTPETPHLDADLPGDNRFTRTGQDWTFARTLNRRQTLPTMRITATGQNGPGLALTRHDGGALFFTLAGTWPQADRQAPPPKRVRVYWDRSLSRRDADLAAERRLLQAYLAHTGQPMVDLVRFAADAPQIDTGLNAAQLDALLGAATYRGATSFAGLERAPLPAADTCLIFTDGAATLDSRAVFAPTCRVTVVNSSPAAQPLRLDLLARQADGRVVDLAGGEAAALNALMAPAAQIVSVQDGRGERHDFRMIESEGANWRLVGPLAHPGPLTLTFRQADGRLMRQSFSVPAIATDGNGPGAFWAQQRVARLALDPVEHAEMRRVARRYAIAGPSLSFLVLERPDQYLNADIEPPAGFPAEWMTDYAAQRRAMKESRAQNERVHYERLLSKWAAEVAWWKRENTQVEGPKGDVTQVVGERLRYQTSAIPLAVNAAPADTSARRPAAPSEGASDDSGGASSAASPAIALNFDEAVNDQSYLAPLKAAMPAERMAVLTDLERRYGALPAFYLDAATWFRGQKSETLAQALELSALELPTADDETRLIVAHRLLRAGAFDRAVALFELLAARTTDRPQPKRALALALATRGRHLGPAGRADLERAFALLTDVALNTTDSQFWGIDVIALTEANALIPALQAVGGHWALDPRLVALLPTDVRIVVEWTNDDADLDLWVKEPGGEAVSFRNRLSRAGGRLSDDMIDGYGPEAYAIRQAAPGAYEVRVNGFSPDRLNPNGRGRVMARLIRHFGTPQMREEMIDTDIGFDRQRARERDSVPGKPIATLTVAPAGAPPHRDTPGR